MFIYPLETHCGYSDGVVQDMMPGLCAGIPTSSFIPDTTIVESKRFWDSPIWKLKVMVK
jgi:hypothetical protein